jgi:hypothetical protein
MIMKKTRFFLPAFLLLSLMTAFGQELKIPQPSPTQTVKQTFGLSDITITYSRPSAKGRVVFGDLVPYDKVWRTGANESTKISFSEDVKIQGNDIDAGTYALYSIPGKSEWTIILSKNTTWWGAYSYTETEDLLRFKVKAETVNSPVEAFTMTFDNMADNSVTLSLLWEKTRIPITITTEVDARVMKNIDAAMAPENRPFLQAASYYYEHDKDLTKALGWVEEWMAANPKAYWGILLKARIQLKLKDYKNAIGTAEKVVSLAKEDKNDEYVTLGEKVIKEARKSL